MRALSMDKPKRDWAWKRLTQAAGEKKRPLNYRKPDYMINGDGRTVRFHVPHPITPAIERLLTMIRKVEIDGDECWVVEGKTFRVDEEMVTTPARFMYQEATGEKLRPGDALRQTCKTPRFVRPAHREKRPVK
jgi:hypothetical protein